MRFVRAQPAGTQPSLIIVAATGTAPSVRVRQHGNGSPEWVCRTTYMTDFRIGLSWSLTLSSTDHRNLLLFACKASDQWPLFFGLVESRCIGSPRRGA